MSSYCLVAIAVLGALLLVIHALSVISLLAVTDDRLVQRKFRILSVFVPGAPIVILTASLLKYKEAERLLNLAGVDISSLICQEDQN